MAQCKAVKCSSRCKEGKGLEYKTRRMDTTADGSMHFETLWLFNDAAVKLMATRLSYYLVLSPSLSLCLVPEDFLYGFLQSRIKKRGNILKGDNSKIFNAYPYALKNTCKRLFNDPKYSGTKMLICNKISTLHNKAAIKGTKIKELFA